MCPRALLAPKERTIRTYPALRRLGKCIHLGPGNPNVQRRLAIQRLSIRLKVCAFSLTRAGARTTPARMVSGAKQQICSNEQTHKQTSKNIRRGTLLLITITTHSTHNNDDDTPSGFRSRCPPPPAEVEIMPRPPMMAAPGLELEGLAAPPVVFRFRVGFWGLGLW